MISPGQLFFRDLAELGTSRVELFRLSLFTLLFAIFEGVGLGLLLPIADFAIGVTPEDKSLLARMLHWLGITDFTNKPVILVVLLCLAFLPFMCRIVLQYIRDIDVARIKYKIISHVTKRAVATYLASNLTYLGEQDTGALQSSATVEAERAAEAMSSRVIFFTSMVLVIVYIVLMTFISFWLTIYIIPLLTLIALLFRRQGRKSKALSMEVSRQNQNLGHQINDNLNGIQRIKMRVWESRTISHLFRTIERIIRHRMGIERLQIQTQIAMNPILVIAAFSAVYVAIAHLDMTLQTLGIYLLIMTRLGPQALLMNVQWSNMKACMASYNSLNQQFLAGDKHRENTESGSEFTGFEQEIRFDDILFAYPSGDLVLKNLSCSFEKGRTTAIIGKSGSGKTTITRLLAAFYFPTSGKIFADEKVLDEFSIASIRRNMAIVPQDPYLFNDTIKNNVCFGLDSPVSTEQLEHVLDIAHCNEFIDRLEDGIDTVLGSQGSRLSHGQRQRLAIAHAILLKPALLILDEPTSALDSESEQAIQDTLQQLKGNLTIIVIAHRLTTIRHADKILLLESGSVTEEGTHEQLLQNSERYRSFFQYQQST